ncbi:hypothetical protein FMEAI12_7090003 [Parafrankia sp. Ea1.12]|nr:hypothetical protein FMEAI12_7090003 [Parafrankia sp. Ea1.12]
MHQHGTYQGVTGFDSGRRGRGSGPRMSGYLVNDPFRTQLPLRRSLLAPLSPSRPE